MRIRIIRSESQASKRLVSKIREAAALLLHIGYGISFASIGPSSFHIATSGPNDEDPLLPALPLLSARALSLERVIRCFRMPQLVGV